MPFDNGLTPAQAERLAILAEECGEVVQIVGKILRHGYDSKPPSTEDGYPSNKVLLMRELGDVAVMVGIMESAGDHHLSQILDVHAAGKIERLKRNTHHQNLE